MVEQNIVEKTAKISELELKKERKKLSRKMSRKVMENEF